MLMVLMTANEVRTRIEKDEDVLSLAIEKWVRLGGRYAWLVLKGEVGAEKYMRSDTCPLCFIHTVEGSRGTKKWSHCLGKDAQNPCPLVDDSENNVAGCGPQSLWLEARRAVEHENRPAFMKTRAKILRKLRAARKWY